LNYVCVSGGKDSAAQALLLHEQGVDFELLFSDTGAELPETYYILPRLAMYLRKKLVVISNGPFFQWLNHFGYILPSPRMRWCTKQLKMNPQINFLKKSEAESVYVGIRADEAQRARLDVFSKGQWEYKYPLLEAGMGKKDVLALCRKHDMLSPAYEWRSSTSCFCCPFQRKNDWRGLMVRHPDLFALSEDWELQCKLTNEMKGTGKGYTWIEGVTLGQFRDMVDRQVTFDWLDEPEEEACTICQW
jgi:3'-phosphoadenosine 5'-phosphosulfate sulfotransferase (PAPS reductase)/FAD synthetase